MMPPVIDVIAVSEDKLLYVTDKFLWGKKKTPNENNVCQEKTQFFHRYKCHGLLSCHDCVINLSMPAPLVRAHPLQSKSCL